MVFQLFHFYSHSVESVNARRMIFIVVLNGREEKEGEGKEKEREKHEEIAICPPMKMQRSTAGADDL